MAVQPPQYLILPQAGIAPAATMAQSGVIDGGTKRVVDRFDPGRYLLRLVVSSAGAAAAPTPAYFAY